MLQQERALPREVRTGISGEQTMEGREGGGGDGQKGKAAGSQGQVPWNTNSLVIPIVEKRGDNKVKAQCLRVAGGHLGYK